MQAKYLQIRREAYAQGRSEAESILAEPSLRDFVCMYIGEGYKRSRNTVALANSDPRVVCLANKWITAFARNPVTYSFQHHIDQDPEELRDWWAYHLNADPSRIRFQRKSNSGQLSGRTWRSRWGVITVCANDTHFRARLQAWMDWMMLGWL